MPPSLSLAPEMISPSDARTRLIRLQAERLEVLDAGVDPACAYIDHLDAAISAARTKFVTSAVTAIASLRGGLTAPLLG